MPLKPPSTRERLPERKQMTIAIGLLANDGLVVAADAEESTGDYMKGTKGKIACFYSQEGEDPATFQGRCVSTCAIAGAGNSGYVQALSDQFGGVFLANPNLSNLSIQGMPALAAASLKKKNQSEALNPKFEQCLKSFYKEHVIPFATLPERKRPDVEMLIAIQRRNARALFTTEKTVINPVLPFKAIGWGSTFAELLLNRFWGPMSVEQAEVLAAYVVFLTKESVETCGKFTTVVSMAGSKIVKSSEGNKMLPTERAKWMDHEVIEKWESAFRKKWWKAEREKVFSLIDEELSDLPTPRLSGARMLKGQR
jgi:hypothetical protein